MRIRRLLPVLPALALLTGCAGALKHEVTVSPKLRELPVHTVCVFDPAFRTKIKRSLPDDFQEMKPDRLADVARRMMPLITAILSASVTVDGSCTANEEAKAWAAEIAEGLVASRVPLSTKPMPLPVEAVLILGVKTYGTSNLQTQITPLFMKPIKVGAPDYEHRVSIQAILVKPQTGEVLFDVLDEEAQNQPTISPELLDEMTRKVGWALLEGFFPKPR